MPDTTRQLAAIMFTDIVGYTALMGRDSNKALDLVRKSKDIQKPLVEKFNGKWLKEMGDGMMAQFNTALDAVECAVEIQRASRADFEEDLRIGIHSGDITIENDDVFGDGVNVASRLEAIADPGGIYISESIQKAIQGQTTIQAKYLGEVDLKNVEYGVRTYALQGVGLPVPEFQQGKELKGRFWAEVNRRGLFRAGLMYLLVALLVLLILREFGTSFGITPTLQAIIYGLLILGFPISLTLAWMYEQSPEGFVRTTSKASWENPYPASRRKPFTNRLLIGMMALVILFTYFFPTGNTPSINDDKAKTVAVLPFKNLSDDPETGYFVDGIMDVILSNLARIGDLKVTSRTSVEQYRERQIPVKEIAQELNVNYLVEASVQRFGDRMRITVQLIDAESDQHIWADNYDKEWTDILELESDLSIQIANQLNANIGSREINLINTAHKTNPLAHDFNLKGDAYRNRSLGDKQDLEFAIEMYEKALQIDPNYALAWHNLGEAHRTYYHFYHLRNEEQKQKIKAAMDKALALDPSLLEARMGQAAYLYSCEYDYQGAVDIINELLLEYPGNVDLKSWLGYIYRRTDESEKADEFFREAITLEPTLWFHWYGYGQNLRRIRKYRESEEAFKRAILLNPSDVGTYAQLASLYRSIGESEKARETLDKHFLKTPENISLWATQEIFDRNYENAIEHFMTDPDTIFSFQNFYRPKSLEVAMVHYFAGSDSAKILFQKSMQPLEQKLLETPNDDRVLSSLGMVYAGLGEKAKAIEYGEKAFALMNTSLDGLRGIPTEHRLKDIYIMTAEYTKALELIRHLLRHTGYITVGILKQHPIYDPLRDLPEFQAILDDPEFQISF